MISSNTTCRHLVGDNYRCTHCSGSHYAYINGVPKRVVVDNLKAGIIKACFEEPQAQLAYRECAEHYGFLIAPCRPYTPEHKSKVERSVGYVKQNFLATFGEKASNRRIGRYATGVWKRPVYPVMAQRKSSPVPVFNRQNRLD